MIEILEVDKYLEIAQNVGVFTHKEIEVINELLDNYQRQPEKDYFLINYKEKEQIAGFVIFGRTPLTEFFWDIYWLVVDKAFQKKGIGRKLLHDCERFILKRVESASIRIETSSKMEFAHARNLYIKQNYKESGRISNFYRENDHLIVYYKELESNIASLLE